MQTCVKKQGAPLPGVVKRKLWHSHLCEAVRWVLVIIMLFKVELLLGVIVAAEESKHSVKHEHYMERGHIMTSMEPGVNEIKLWVMPCPVALWSRVDLENVSLSEG